MAHEDREGGFVVTYSGGRFYPFDPDPADVSLTDIAAGLAHQCRFSGHCLHFYSVALHSIYVSTELEARSPRVQLYGLLHDAAEAYMGDLARPIKAEFQRFERAERRVLDAVWEAVEVPPPTPDEWAVVMAADDRLLAYEADEVLADGSWADAPPDLQYDLRVEDAAAVRERFLDRAERLLDEVR